MKYYIHISLVYISSFIMSQSVPVTAIPIGAVPMDAIPMDAVPMDAFLSESIHEKRALVTEDEYLVANAVIDEAAAKFI